jgi:hypothetical protein
MINLGQYGNDLAKAAFNSMISGVGLQMTFLFGSRQEIEDNANLGSPAYLPSGHQMQYNNGLTQIKW